MKTQSHVHRMRFCKTWHRTVIGYQTFYRVCGCCCSATKSCVTVCNPTDYKVRGILQARILEWVAFPFSRGSSQPRDQTQVSCIAGGFFTSWAKREAQEYWSGYPIPSPENLPNPGIKPGFPALQVDSLPTEISGKPNPKGNQSWIFIGRTDAEAETPILWPLDVTNWLIWKDPDAGKDWKREEKGMIEDEIIGWHHQLNGHEFE